uniref:Large ribosomal subunit protein P2 n=1 Tax=Oncorhynchus mykiss TaxID=8022 RepID=A0A8K9XME6_ONCMY
MRYVAAYLLAALGGNNNPSSQNIKDILGSVGIEADDQLNPHSLMGKDINEILNCTGSLPPVSGSVRGPFPRSAVEYCRGSLPPVSGSGLYWSLPPVSGRVRGPFPRSAVEYCRGSLPPVNGRGLYWVPSLWTQVNGSGLHWFPSPGQR